MAELVSAWTEKDRTFLVERDGEDVRIRSLPARWSLFAIGLDDEDRSTVARDKRVTGVRQVGGYTRIDCRNRWARKEVVEILEGAGEGNPDFELLEADVSPTRRLLSDVDSLEVSPSPRLVFFDLETDSRGAFEEVRQGKRRILSWAATGSERSASAVLAADTDAAESELLEGLLEFLSPFDCVLAWFGSGFDFLVLQARVNTLGVKFRGRPVPWNRWTWLDHLEVYKKYNLHSDGGGEQKSSFALNHVAGYLLGEGKLDFDASRTWEAWAAGGERRAELLAYNERDTALLPRIEEATGYLALHLAVCHICRVFPDTESLNATAQGDGFLLRLGDEHGYRWPTRKRFDETPDPFKGAYVMEPTRTGAIDNVHVCDFAGLYPAIMRTFNMSPDTKLEGPADEAVTFSGVKPMIEAGSCQLPNRATWFATDRDGMFRIALDRLVEKRGEYTAAMKAEIPGTEKHARFKRLSGAFKIVANSFYGITGSPWSRFFDPEIAEGVTQTGRWLLEQVIDEAKGAGLDPFYGDTDSVFVSGDVDEFRAVVARLNKSWGDRLRPWGIGGAHWIDLDFEKTFRRVIMITAKRYVGSLAWYKGKAAAPDAKPEVKGLEFKRGDTIRLARSFQFEVVKRLLEPELPTAAAMWDMVKTWRMHTLENHLELEDVIISQSLSKPIDEYKAATPPAHVRVAKLLKERGEAIAEGARVPYLVVRNSDPKDKKMNPVPAHDPGAFEAIDRAYYWERRVYPPVVRVLEKVYPDEAWAETTAVKRERKHAAAVEANRGKLDDLPLFAASRGPKLRRRKKKSNGGIEVTIVEHSPAEDGGAEGHRRRLLLEAVRAAIEAHPGSVPVTILIKWRQVAADGQPEKVKVTIPTGLSMARDRDARRALERLVKSEHLTGF